MHNSQPFHQVDRSAIKVGQTLTMLLLVMAFSLDSWPLVALVGGANLLGAAVPRLSLFGQLYRRLLKPAGLVKPRLIPDDPAPHRFAQAVGGSFVALSAGLLLAGQPTWGWLFSWLVIILAGCSVFLGFCAGCFIYYQFSRLGVADFECSHCLDRTGK